MLSNNPGGLSNRLKGYMTCLRRDAGAKIKWDKSSQVQCEWKDLFVDESKLGTSGTSVCEWRLLLNDKDAIWPGFSSVREWYGTSTQWRDIDFEYHRIPAAIQRAYGEVLNRLVIQPTILDTVQTFAKQHFNEHTVSVHIRSWNDDLDRKAKFHSMDTFNQLMERLHKQNEKVKFFVCTDDEEEVKKLNKTLPIIRYESVMGGTKPFIEMLLLSRNRRMIGSYVSTFSEMAWWYSKGEMQHVWIVKKNQVLEYFDPNVTETLSELGQKYGTDKVWHKFTNVYDSLWHNLREHVTSLMEIGVFFGASMQMWLDYFPAAQIHGVDAFEGKQGNGTIFKDATKFYDHVKANPSFFPRLTLHKKDQNNKDHLLSLSGVHDIIIDDGSHTMQDQHQALAVLFKLVRPGGYFVIEDIHCARQANYGLLPDRSNSTLVWVNQYQATGKWSTGMYCTKAEVNYLNEWCDGVKIYVCGPDSMTCVVRKRMLPMSGYLDIVRSPQPELTMVTYSTYNQFNPTLRRHREWAKTWNEDATLISYSQRDLAPNGFSTRHEHTLKHDRGAGYWLWKSYVTLATLMGINSEFISYCDAGSAWKMPWRTIKQYFVDHPSAYIYTFRLPYAEKQWTTKDCFVGTNTNEPKYTDTFQTCATAFVLRRSANSIDFVREWHEYCCNPALLINALNEYGQQNYPEFREHREDQSLFSLTCKKNRIIPAAYVDDCLWHRCFRE